MSIGGHCPPITMVAPPLQVNRDTVFKSGLFGGQNVLLSELKVLTLQVSVFLSSMSLKR